MTTLGNLCTTLAALIYLVPVQYLLLELARKRDDGGSGAILGMIVVGAMWILLLVGLLAVTTRGGLDVLPVRRGVTYGLVVGASLALAVVTFLSLVSLNRVGWTERLTVGLPIYVIPPLTIAFIALVLNPGLAPRIPVGVLRLPWLVLAGLSLAGCVCYLGMHLVRRTSLMVRQAAHDVRSAPEIEAKRLADVPTLDPELYFRSLMSDASYAESPELRRLANERLRTHPDLIGALITALGEREPDTALAFIAQAELSEDERRRLAGPLHQSMEFFCDYIHGRLHYLPKDWKSRTRAWGRPIFRAVALKFAGTGPDFSTLPAAFDQAFVPDAR